MLEIAVCDDDIADLECAVNMLHKIFTSQKIAYHIESVFNARAATEEYAHERTDDFTVLVTIGFATQS